MKEDVGCIKYIFTQLCASAGVGTMARLAWLMTMALRFTTAAADGRDGTAAKAVLRKRLSGHTHCQSSAGASGQTRPSNARRSSLWKSARRDAWRLHTTALPR